MNRAFRWLGMAALLTASGCGLNHPPLGKVEGTVRHNSTPIAAGHIVFEVAGARTAQGRIVDGRIVDVTSYSPGDGAGVGLARIAVFSQSASVSLYESSVAGKPAEASVAGRASDTGGIPARYNDPETSGLSHDVIEGRNELTLDLHD